MTTVPAEAEYQRIFHVLDKVAEAIATLDDRGRLLYANEQAARLVGRPRHEILGQPVWDVYPPAVGSRFEQAFRAALASRQETRYVGYHPETRCYYEVRFVPYEDVVLVFHHDVTERQQAEEVRRALSAERDALLEQLKVYLERMPIGCIVSDPQGRFRDWNPAAERIFGYRRDEALGRTCFDLIVPASARELVEDVLRRLRAGDMAAHSINQNRTKDGRLITCEWYNTPVLGPRGRCESILGMVIDVTERRRLEDQYRQAHKMEAVGQLAGGVAHDFNNLLTVINGYVEILLAMPGFPAAAAEMVAQIGKAGARAAALTQQLLAFSRRQVLTPEILDLNAVVTDTERMLRRVIGEDIDLVASLDPELGRIQADPGQLEQVLLNLAVNARDAMPEGGKITIESRNVDLDHGYAGARSEVQPGRYVMLSVSDDGHGMDADTKARIFEPFFTTKGPSKGTGLGLATVYGIIKQSGGHIEVYSEPGVGTTFKVYFPRVDAPTPATPQGESPAALGRSEVILLVEDEDAVRSLGRQALERAGYRVLEASNGRAALQVANAHAGAIDLLVTDVVMPDMGGRQLAGNLGRLRPGMSVLYVSGYTEDAVVRHGVLHDSANFLQKPFSLSALVRKVRDVLDEGKPSPRSAALACSS